MELTSPTILKELLAKFNASPSKTMGQNFLIDKNILEKIIQAGALTKNDTVLEVGPGIGTLTQELAKKAGRVVAIEKDHTMINILSQTLNGFDNVEVIEADVLEFLKLNNFKLISNFKFQISNYKVIANLPYYITSPVIRGFLECKSQPEFMIFMVQKEVAQRICQKPPHMSILSCAVQYYAKPEVLFYVSKGCFLPSPKIDSAIIKITPKFPVLEEKNRELKTKDFFKVVKAGFSQPRKQLANNLTKSLKLKREVVEQWLLNSNIKPNQRAETLLISDWENLAKSYPQ